MSSLLVRDGQGFPKYLKMQGTGTEVDPYVPQQDVIVGDQISPILIMPFYRETASSTLAAQTVIDNRNITVVSATNFAIGQFLNLFNIAANRWYKGYITNIVGNVLTMTDPLDFVYQIGDVVGAGTSNMAVNGSVTPQIFSIRGSDPGIAMKGHITRIMLTIDTSTEPGWVTFGNIATLTNGIVLRHRNAEMVNIFNARSNSELINTMHTMDKIDNIKFGVYGMRGMMTFSGSENLGVAIELGPGEDLEFIIQDDLTGLSGFKVIAEGHAVI